MKKYYVYRFKDENDKIIYVGKTVNFHNRMKQHFSDHNGHLPAKCYDNVCKIEYIVLSHPIDMTIYELYYISKYRPLYNTNDVLDDNESDIATITNHDKWITSKFLEENIVTYKDIKDLNLDKFTDKYMLVENSKVANNFLGDDAISLKEFYHVLESYGIVGKVNGEMRCYTDYSINRFFINNGLQYKLNFYKKRFNFPRSRSYRYYVLTKL